MSDLNETRPTDHLGTSIYEFLESIVEAIRPTESSDNSEIAPIDKTIKPGGYSEDIFIFLSDKERDNYSCCICYSILKEANQCKNGHKFCYNCIYVWSSSERDSADCCPACRCDGQYARNEQVIDRLNRKRVKCKEDNCNWRGFLLDFDSHDHRNYDYGEFKSTLEYPALHKPTSVSSISSIGASSSCLDTVSGSSVTTGLTRPTINNNLLSNISSHNNKNNSNNHNAARSATINNRLPNLNSRYSSSTTSRFPPINLQQSSSSSISSNFNPPTDYRRLAPTYAERRRRQYSFGTDHLAMLLFALTSDFDDNRVTGSVSNDSDQTDTNRNFRLGSSIRSRSVTTSGESSLLNTSSSTTGSNQSHTTGRSYFTQLSNDTENSSRNHTDTPDPGAANTISQEYQARPRPWNRSRLNEFHTINRRLTEVSNSLDRLSQQIASNNVVDDSYDSDVDV